MGRRLSLIVLMMLLASPAIPVARVRPHRLESRSRKPGLPARRRVPYRSRMTWRSRDRPGRLHWKAQVEAEGRTEGPRGRSESQEARSGGEAQARTGTASRLSGKAGKSETGRAPWKRLRADSLSLSHWNSPEPDRTAGQTGRDKAAE